MQAVMKVEGLEQKLQEASRKLADAQSSLAATTSDLQQATSRLQVHAERLSQFIPISKLPMSLSLMILYGPQDWCMLQVTLGVKGVKERLNQCQPDSLLADSGSHTCITAALLHSE